LAWNFGGDARSSSRKSCSKRIVDIEEAADLTKSSSTKVSGAGRRYLGGLLLASFLGRVDKP